MPAKTEQNREKEKEKPDNLPDLPDEDLVDMFQNGNEKAFDEIVRRYQDYIYNMVSFNVSDREVVQDLAQQTFVNAYEALEDFEKRSSLKTWLFRIAKNLCYSHHRKSGRNREIPSGSFRSNPDNENPGYPEPEDPDNNPVSTVSDEELKDIVRKTIEELKDDFREILFLREIEDQPYEEISEILDIPVGTVRSRLYRARDRLKEVLIKKFGEDFEALLDE